MEAVPSLSDLPEAVLLQMLRHLDGAELARVCAQDRRLRQIGGEQALWQALALTRWPGASPEHHRGDWQQLYRHRACLPGAFVTCVDRCHELTQRAAGKQQLRINSASLPCTSSRPDGSPVKSNVYGFNQRPYASIPGMLYDGVMQMLFSLCLWMHRVGSKSAGGSGACGVAIAQPRRAPADSLAVAAAVAVELGLVRQDMAWWLNHKPEAVLQFARRSCDLLGDWDMWGSGFTSWPEVLWRRSALQFLADLSLGLEDGVCPSMTARLQRDLERLDDSLRSVDAEGSWLATRRPEGLPRSHWWYCLRGQMSGSTC